MNSVREEEARLLLQEWVDQQGHNRCWYYPELFNELVKIFHIQPSVEPKLPPRSDFREGCRRYEEEQYRGKQAETPEDIVARKAIIKFRKLKKEFEEHHNGCETCLKAARLRFAGATPDLIDSKRCKIGAELSVACRDMYDDSEELYEQDNLFQTMPSDKTNNSGICPESGLDS